MLAAVSSFARDAGRDAWPETIFQCQMRALGDSQFFLIITFTFQLNSYEVFALSGLLDKAWSQVPSIPPPGTLAFKPISHTAVVFREI